MLKFLLASASVLSAQAAITGYDWGSGGVSSALSGDVTITDPIGTNFDTISYVEFDTVTTTYIGLFLGSSPTPSSHIEGVTGGPVTKIECTTVTLAASTACHLPLYQGGDKFNPVSKGVYTMYEVNGDNADFVTAVSSAAVVTVNPYISAWGSTLNQDKTFATNVVERGDDILVTWDGLAQGNVIELKVDGTGLTLLTECSVSAYVITAADVDGKTRGTASLKTSASGEKAKFAIPGNYFITMHTTHVAACPGSASAIASTAVRQVLIKESDTLSLTYSSTEATSSAVTAGVEAGTKVTVNYNLHSATTAGTYVGLFRAAASGYTEAPATHVIGTSAGDPLAMSFLPVGISGAGVIELEVPDSTILDANGYIVYMLNTNDADLSPLTSGSYGVHGLYGPTFAVAAGAHLALPDTNSDLMVIEAPTGQPSNRPTSLPSGQPTGIPTSPTGQPTGIPTSSPSFVEEPWGEYVWTEKRHRKAGMCENQCSGHGTCEVNGNCKCFTGLDGEDEWTGPDCSSRTCPFDFAWVGASINSNNLHPWAECSNKGLCDRSSGECQCFTGYEGAACQRTVCPDNCNDQGTCWPEKHLASKAGRVYEAPWDAMKHVGCLCDAGYRGPACDQQECPSGADPLAGYGNEAGRDCSGRGICDYSNGICACFTGFFGTRCQHQTTVM